jgi:dihydroxyacetone kinase-like protein
VSLLSNSAATPAGAFLALSDGFLNTGGTSGPLFAMWFRGPADAAADSPVLTLDRFVTGSEAGLTAVQRLGKARVGDKTMVDGIAPALVALRSAAADGLDLAAAVGSAALAARSGALATAGQLARRGRASYVGAAAKGVVDAGALAVALFYESVPR